MSLLSKRILKEIEQLRNDPPSSFVASCIKNNLQEWHFTIRGPEDSDYQNGIYHGKIELPVDYPIKPPNIFFLTPNGRFEIKTKICLNITKFHPENWNPSWTIRTMIEGIIQHFHCKDFAVGSITYTSEQIKKLAEASHKWECEQCGPIINLILPKNKLEDNKNTNLENLNENELEIKREQNESQEEQTSQIKNSVDQEIDFQQNNEQQNGNQEIRYQKEDEIDIRNAQIYGSQLLLHFMNPNVIFKNKIINEQQTNQTQKQESLTQSQLQFYEKIYQSLEEEEQVLQSLEKINNNQQQSAEQNINEKKQKKPITKFELFLLTLLIILIGVFANINNLIDIESIYRS